MWRFVANATTYCPSALVDQRSDACPEATDQVWDASERCHPGDGGQARNDERHATHDQHERLAAVARLEAKSVVGLEDQSPGQGVFDGVGLLDDRDLGRPEWLERRAVVAEFTHVGGELASVQTEAGDVSVVGDEDVFTVAALDQYDQRTSFDVGQRPATMRFADLTGVQNLGKP